jgi:hypothetical protein
LAASWQQRSAGTIFRLACPIGAVIQVDLALIFNDGVTGAYQTVTVGSPGAVYGMPLDGTTDVLLPVGLVTTT